MTRQVELLQKLAQLQEQYPKHFEEVIKEHPEWFQNILDEKKILELVARTKNDSPDGFFAYYEGIHKIEPPKHVKKWVEQMYNAHEQGKGFTLNGFRGSWKSVSISSDFTSWRIGKEPFKTNLVVSANDDNTDKITKTIAEVIEFHPFWKRAFPNVVKDEGRWSSNGYWVIDNSMPREEWVQMQAGVIDPTFLGGGYTSTRINGKHPTGVLAIDDVHGINNSSEIERKRVVKFITTELMKTVVRKDDKLLTWVHNVGVPWGEDTHQALSKSGGFLSDSFPVMVRANEGEGDYIDGVNEMTGVVYDDIVGWWHLSFPERVGVNSIKQDRGLGKFDFHQMMMMDLAAARTGSLRYYTYEEKDVDRSWLTTGGIDVPYEFKERMERESKLSSFAMAFLSKSPKGGAIVVDGVLEHPTIAKAFGYILDAQSNFPNWLMALCEDVGGGKVFRVAAKTMYPQLNIIGSDLGKIIRNPDGTGGKAKDKKTRIQTELAPWLENGVIRISDRRSPYLDTLRDALDNFGELDANKADDRLDCLDSLYHAAKGMPEVLVGRFNEELPEIFMKKKSPHPLAGRRERNFR